MRRSWILGLVLAAVVAGAFVERRMLGLRLYALSLEVPGLGEPTEEGPDARWIDDYYTVQWLDPRTAAIGEPRYFQQTWSYLILGDERAVLFDSGPGVRDVRPVVEALTSLPVTAVPSHLHYDHVGNLARFERIALPDVAGLRERAAGGTLLPTEAEHVGFAEGYEPPELRVTEWWSLDSEIDLGGRSLRVLHTPGHTPESISLLDGEAGLLFTGDYIYPGDLYAFLPGSDLGDYLTAARRLEEVVAADARLFPGHRTKPPGAPEVAMDDVADLRATLERIRAGDDPGDGLWFRSWRVNSRIALLAEPAWLARWD